MRPGSGSHAPDGHDSVVTTVLFDPRGRVGELDPALLARERIAVVGHATSPHGLLSLLGRTQPEVVVAEAGLPTDAECWTFLGRLARLDPNLRAVLIVGDRHDALETALVALAAPARARRDGDDAPPPRVLTNREREILELAATGRSNAAIARLLWLTRDTVKFHLANAYRKLGVHGRVDAIAEARARGLL